MVCASILIKWDTLFLFFYSGSKIYSGAALLDSLWQDYKKEFILGLYINVTRGWRLDRVVSWVTSRVQSTLCSTFFSRCWLALAWSLFGLFPLIEHHTNGFCSCIGLLVEGLPWSGSPNTRNVWSQGWNCASRMGVGIAFSLLLSSK